VRSGQGSVNFSRILLRGACHPKTRLASFGQLFQQIHAALPGEIDQVDLVSYSPILGQFSG